MYKLVKKSLPYKFVEFLYLQKMNRIKVTTRVTGINKNCNVLFLVNRNKTITTSRKYYDKQF